VEMDAVPGAAADRVLAALDDLPLEGDHPPREVIRDVARAAVRRVPDADVPSLDVPMLARHLLAGVRMLDRRAGPVAVELHDPREGDPMGGSVLLLASEDRPFLLATMLDREPT
jgi:hypothetical protein